MGTRLKGEKMDRKVFEMLEMYNKAKENKNYDYNFSQTNNFGGILTMAFVNMQPLDTVYETDDGFCRGTIFPNIDKPFYGGKRI